MSRDSNGDYTLPAGVNPVVAGTTITDDWANTTLNDVATALTDSWDRQGRGAPLANLPMGSFKFTGMAAGSASTDSVRYGQVLNQDAVTIASASTVDLASNLQTSVTVSGTTTITSFGTGAAAGVRKFITFTGNLTLTHSSTLICPGSTNISIAAGDSIEVRSEGSNVWRVTNYQSGGGLSTRLSSLAAATATNTLANTTFNQTWGWHFTGGSGEGLTITGLSTTTSYGTVMRIKLGAAGQSPSNMFVVEGSPQGPGGSPKELLQVTNSSVYLRGWNGYALNAGGEIQLQAGSADATAGGVSIYGGNNTATGGYAGGSVVISGGSSVSGAAGSVIITAGESSSGTDGTVTLRSSNATGALVSCHNSALTLSGGAKAVLDTKHLFVDNTNGAPTISAGGGTGASIAGSDVAFEVTTGTGSPTSVTVTFANAWASAPQIVLVSTTQAGCRLNYAATTTTLQISTDSAWSSGVKVCALVMGLQ